MKARQGEKHRKRCFTGYICA